jgi:hypothetical protein
MDVLETGRLIGEVGYQGVKLVPAIDPSGSSNS